MKILNEKSKEQEVAQISTEKSKEPEVAFIEPKEPEVPSIQPKEQEPEVVLIGTDKVEAQVLKCDCPNHEVGKKRVHFNFDKNIVTEFFKHEFAGQVITQRA